MIGNPQRKFLFGSSPVASIKEQVAAAVRYRHPTLQAPT
jgi:hypothetical protein